ncbi:hypothetical protein PRI8871_02013 [Pseudoprimorskyibacter insulae]|uniref:Mannosylglycerate hydrolase MGH1-like glycoside hydrolase domain-containing protein n=2 Tax=Pseudoprimorskyibacter insulae TaxID=1695997 RepID=A0A2R8AWB4_9RHOB|nr:hypothetical protein PRI8871_02013 [Pseudoprimorskyibacter insulae]
MTVELDARAKEILRGNDRGGYTVPTHGLYPYQWNWDSVFSAWGFSTFDLPRAWVEIETLFASQKADGMVPHIIFHQVDPGYFPGPDVWQGGGEPPTSGISQPPVAAILARLMWEGDRDAGRAAITALYPKMVAWHRWWMEHRVVDGVAVVTHPWESGRDNCPDWDHGMAGVDGSNVGEYHRRDTGHVDADMRPKKIDYDRYLAIVYAGRSMGWDQARVLAEGPFLMTDPAVHFILLRAMDDLAAIGRDLGQDVAEVEGWAETLRAAVPDMWNPDLGAYDAYDLKSGQWANNLGTGAWLSYLAGVENAAMDARLTKAWDKVRYGIPSADPEGATFNPKRYWRGPSWAVMNALIALGFQRMGHEAWDARLRRETADMIRIGGFAEYHDPLDGSPCGGANFSWTAAIWLTWAGRD